MHRFKIFLILILFPLALNSQQKLFVAGTGSIFNQSNKVGSSQFSQSRYSFTPNIGYHINENWILGISSNLVYAETHWQYRLNGTILTSEFTRKAITKGGGLFIRKRFPTTENIALYINAYANYSEDKNETNDDGDFTEQKIYENRTAGLQFGFEYRFGKRWILTSNLGGITYLKRTALTDDFPGFEELNFSITPGVFEVVLGYYLW